MNVDPSYPGTVYSDEVEDFQHRQIIPEDLYYEISANDRVPNNYLGSNIFASFERMQHLKDLELPDIFIQNEQDIIERKVEELEEMLGSYCVGNEQEKGVVLSFFKTVFEQNGELRKSYNQFQQRYIENHQERFVNNQRSVLITDQAEDILKLGALILPNCPNDLFLEMLQEYKKGFELKTTNVREHLNQFYDNELKDLVKTFALNNNLDPEDLVERLSKIKERLKIGFRDTQPFEGDVVLGETNAEGSITMDPFWDFEKLTKPSFTHEVIHNISGHLYRVWKVKDQLLHLEEEDNMISSFAVPEKSGLAILGNLGWLNEGCTELVTSKILNPDVMAYESEIELIKKILNNGEIKIPEELLFKAFFESYGKDLPLDQQLPYLKQFLSETSKSFGSGFLVRLSFFIKVFDGAGEHDLIEKINQNFSEIVEIFTSKEGLSSATMKAINLLYLENT